MRLPLTPNALQNEKEIECLYRILEFKNPKTIMEIGVAYGGTMEFLYSLLDEHYDGLYIGIDISKHLLDIPSNRVARYHNRLIYFYADSQQQSTVESVRDFLKEKDRTIDFLLIDGCHTYEAAKNDFENYSQFVTNPGGVIAFHDIADYQLATLDVHRYWKEVKVGKNTLELIEPNNFHYGIWRPYGIGVIFL